MKVKKNLKRILTFVLVFGMLCGIIPANSMVASAATTSVSLTSLGRKGTVSIGSKTKSGTWWQMKLNGKKAFCIDLGYTCHVGNTYASEETHHWDQNTGGDKNGYYAKIVRWYVLGKNRSNKAFVMSQALIWSIAEGRNSDTQLKDVIQQVKGNINISPEKSVNDLYEDIFKPSGAWTADVTFWQKTGNSKWYQRLVTVDADDVPEVSSINDSTYYRQRITVLKKDVDGNGLGGIQFTLDADNLDDLYSFAMVDRDGKAYITGVTNKPKKVSVNVVKIDKYSSDKKAHGDANLDGAQFQLYADASGKTKATVYDDKGMAKTAGIYSVVNGRFVTDYLRSGYTYYLKEVNAPAGYTLSTDVLPITVDASNVTAEYTSNFATKEYGNQPVLGKIAIQKYASDGKTGLLPPEVNTTFQVYLASKRTYDACDDYERGIIKTDKNGYGITGNLYYGKYIVHQVDSGDVDAVHVDDFFAEVTESGKSYTYPMNNEMFKAYLRILKKDGSTEKQVLKPGTAYQIYKVTDDGEKLVEQSYSNGNKTETINRFVTDATGEIMTVKELKSGTYRIYETDSASGLHITEKYIEVVINSKADNYESFTDEDGYTHAVVTVTYTNHETAGRLKLYKTGEMLTGFQNGKFVYESRFLKGTVFEVTAAEDIMTQDNQGTHWYDKGDLVATITTGKGAEFTKECKDVTGYTVDEDGMVTVQLPLGKYHVEEKQTLYGYVLPDDGWDVEFTWDNKDEEYVLNATDVTDENGVLRVGNARAKTQVSLFKSDAITKKVVAGAEFGIYTTHDIFNIDGEKIVDAGTRLGTVTTGADGRAVSDLDLPLMSEEYPKGADSGDMETPSVETSEEAEKTETPDTDEVSGNVVTRNSGDYYLKELSVPGSYYLNETEYPVHLEYKDQEAEVITADVEAVNTQTSTVISKTSITNSGELPGCELQITDERGNIIVNWTSGNKDSIKWNEKLEELGYCNATAVLDEKGAVQVNGLLHDTTYTLTETRPADGFVTAESIAFQLIPGENGQTLAVIVNGENRTLQKDNIVHMVDDTTKVEISKTEITGSEEIPGCELEIMEKDTDTVIESWTSTKEKHIIEQQLTVGKTYILTEKRPADGYVTADSIEFTIEDSGAVQSVQMKDDTTKIRLIKLAGDTGQGLRGAKFEVFDSSDKKVMSFESKEDGYDITGKLKVGETYTFKEIEAPKGYQLAESVKYTVKDTGEVQKVSVTDKKTPGPGVPQTGGTTPLVAAVILLFLLGSAGIFFFRRKRVSAK